MREVIADTSPIQYLYQADLLDLLPTLYQKITIPIAVAHEIEQGHTLGISLPVISSLSWIDIKQVRDATLLPLAPDLGQGEREVIALTVQTPGSLALLDDALARQHARLLGIAFTGTLGVLLKAKESGYLSAVSPVLDTREQLRFRLDPATRAAVLKIAGE